MMHTMVDIETLGLWPGCPVMSIGACRFNPENWQWPDTADQFTMNLEIASQNSMGMENDEVTLEWWKDQPVEARIAVTSNAQQPLVAMRSFAEWYKKYPGPIWSHGASFDIPILGYLYNRFCLEAPWYYRDVRDTRTLYSFINNYRQDKVREEFLEEAKKVSWNITRHVALDDAIAQAFEVSKAYLSLGIRNQRWGLVM